MAGDDTEAAANALTAKAALVYQHVAEGRDRIIADRMALMAEPGVVQSGEDVDRPLAKS